MKARQIVIIVASVAALVGGVMLARQGKIENTMVWLVAGLALLILALVGFLFICYEMSRSPSKMQLAEAQAKMGLDSLEIVRFEDLQRFFTIPFFSAKMREGRFPIVLAAKAHAADFFIIGFEPVEKGIFVFAPVWLQLLRMRSPLAIVFLLNGVPDLPDFEICQRDDWGRHFAQGGNTRSQFAKYYQLTTGRGDSVSVDLIGGFFLADTVLEFFAGSRTWSCYVHQGHLLVSKKAAWGIQTEMLPDLLSEALHVQSMLLEGKGDGRTGPTS